MNRNCPVKWVMQHPVISANEDFSLEKLIHIFDDDKFNHLPVTRNNKLIGIISKEDILKVILDQLTSDHAEIAKGTFDTKAKEIMSPNPIKVYENQAIDLAVEILLQGAFHILPVVNEEDELVGMVSAADLLKIYYQESN